MGKTGRKSKADQWLTDDGLLLLEGWARDGATDEDLFKKIGIGKTTFYSWLKHYPNILNAIKKGRAPIDFEIENALLKLALGHDYEVEEPIKVKVKQQLEGKGMVEREEVQIVKRTVHAPPNLGAIAFWAKNRIMFEGKHKYSDNPATDEIRRRELELKEKQAEAAAKNINDDITITINWGGVVDNGQNNGHNTE